MLHDFTLTTLMFIIAVLFTLAFLLYLRNRALEALLDRVPEKVVEKTWGIFPQLPNVQIGGLDFVLTCSACPEQMDVYRLGQQVGYLRLRHGHFTVEYKDCGEELLLEGHPHGDGDFDDDERLEWLTKAANAIRTRLDRLNIHN